MEAALDTESDTFDVAAATTALNEFAAQFSASEADLIISAIKAGKSKQEAAKIDQMVRLFRSAASGKKR